MTDSMVRTYLASDAAREHYAKTMPTAQPVNQFEDRIKALELTAATYQLLFETACAAMEEQAAKSRQIAASAANIRTERDMLAKRIQELLRETAEPEETVEPDPVFAAIEVHQKQGVR